MWLFPLSGTTTANSTDRARCLSLSCEWVFSSESHNRHHHWIRDRCRYIRGHPLIPKICRCSVGTSINDAIILLSLCLFESESCTNPRPSIYRDVIRWPECRSSQVENSVKVYLIRNARVFLCLKQCANLLTGWPWIFWASIGTDGSSSVSSFRNESVIRLQSGRREVPQPQPTASSLIVIIVVDQRGDLFSVKMMHIIISFWLLNFVVRATQYLIVGFSIGI